METKKEDDAQPFSETPLELIEAPPHHPPTTYLETLVHLFKGNVGPGLFALGIAFKNGGLVLAPILTLMIAIICIHCQHLLIKCANRMRILRNEDKCSNYPDTVEKIFESGPTKTQSCSKGAKTIVNIFICVTELGFCCVYLVFISTNVQQVLKAQDIIINVHILMIFVFLPVWVTSLITNLKWLTPVSLVSNVCMVTGFGITLYYALKDGLSPIAERSLYTTAQNLPVYFGTAIFAFEGTALILPLKNAMGTPSDFERPLGVLNVGMFMVVNMFISAGFLGYWKWGEDVGDSLTLNIGDTILAQAVKLMVGTGVLLGYPLQFFVAIQIMWPHAMQCLHLEHRPFTGELFFRTVMVLVTLAIAELVPALSLFITLIGSVCSTSLTLIFPPLIELLLRDKDKKGPRWYIYVKNSFILGLSVLGFTTGTYQSLRQIILNFSKHQNE